MNIIKGCILISLIISIFIGSFSGCIESTKENQILNYNFYIKDSYTKNTEGWNSTHFNSISDAITKAENNSIIYVQSGIYNENIIVNKPIILIGEDANTTIIDAGQNDDVIFVEKDGWINISGFTLRNTSLGPYPYDQAGIDLRTASNIIKNNIFENNNCGIHVRYGDDNIISHNLFQNNEQFGIYVYSSSNDNLISHNIFTKNPTGCRVKSSRDCIIRDNLFFENSHKGLYMCCGSNFNEIYRNIFINNSRNADDQYNNSWYVGNIGNYWYDYVTNQTLDPVDENNDGIFDSPYDIPVVNKDDLYPLSVLPFIENSFIDMDYIIQKYL